MVFSLQKGVVKDEGPGARASKREIGDGAQHACSTEKGSLLDHQRCDHH